MKKRRRKKKNNKFKRKLTYGIAAFAFVFIFGYSIVNSLQNLSNDTNRAALVDQVSISDMYYNQTFIDTTISILEEDGWTVDYYAGEEVTVDFYKEDLATHDYRLIILRVHSALGENRNSPLGLWTSEIYDNTTHEEDARQLCKMDFNTQIYGDNNTYFGILPGFIRGNMKGWFNDAVILHMGCNGIAYYEDDYYYVEMAKAFLSRGAKVFIGWDGPVLGSISDVATIHILRHLITERQTIGNTVLNTLEEVGSDPKYGSELQYYPQKVENYVIPIIASDDPKEHDPG